MVQFRKSKKSGPFRFTLSQRGIGTSVGGGPFRLSLGADGRARRTVRVPGVGLYDTKTIGGGRGRRGARKTRHPFLWLLAVLVGFGLVIHACSSDKSSDNRSGSSSPKPAEQPVPWAGAPADGQWPTDAYDRVPFGQLTPVPPGGPFTEFQFAVVGPPQLTTTDDGKTVRIISKVTVHRVEDKGFSEGIAKGQSFMFQPGVTAPENRMDESHGTDPTVVCENDRPRTGETTVCDVSFTAPASEIPNSYWEINRFDVGTWPSQL
ncbi:DUF4236 domain-containing protein [Mycolicibacterium sp. 120270]|uniref:DUF4236 domain-containing protein n=1 Tax=Mycolicibacterium sp. 120270 TaxID=3090600 RepID=UPI00299D07A1|nr:DUF4236 domain-containing protein [Mycolicibacterium sp. 120270]MDX1881844.1 DUF4236 domain-containing protein [Mycolicibacterium sp. 120270]